MPGSAVDIRDISVNKSRRSSLLCSFHVVSGGWVRSVAVNTEYTQMLWGNTSSINRWAAALFSWGGFEGRPVGETENGGMRKKGQRSLSSWGWMLPLPLEVGPWMRGRVLGSKLRGVGSHVVQNCPSLAESLWGALSYGLQDAPCWLFLSEVPHLLFPTPMGRNTTQRREITKVLQALSACCRMWPPLLIEQSLHKMLSILLVNRVETVVP